MALALERLEFNIPAEDYQALLRALERARQEFREIDLVKMPEAAEERERRLIENYAPGICLRLYRELGRDQFIRMFGASNLEDAFYKCIVGAMRLMDREGGDEYKVKYLLGLTSRILSYAERPA